MIIGIGIDLVEKESFEKRIQRTPTMVHTILKLTSLLSTESTLSQNSNLRQDKFMQDAMSNLAAFEALLKASTFEVRRQISNFKLRRGESGKPEFVFAGPDSESISNLKLHLTITTQPNCTLALVILER